MNIDFVGRHLQVEEKTRILAVEKLERLQEVPPGADRRARRPRGGEVPAFGRDQGALRRG